MPGLVADEVVGRENELAAVEAFAVEAGRGAFVLEGEAGAGKTTLWLRGIDAAVASGRTVLVARPSGTEVGFAFAALGDLLEGRGGEATENLPGPQRRSLRVALSLEEAGGDEVEERVVALATLGALRELARAGPVVVAIDDVQWLDPSSAAALEFATRRLRGEPVRFLVTHRSGSAGFVLPEPLTRVRVGPLSLGALQRLLVARLDANFARPTLRRLWEISGGNPFYALELARALARRGGELTLGNEVPVPTDLSTLLRERLSTLDDDTRATLLAAALVAEPTLDVLQAVGGPQVWRRLEAAVAAQIIVLDRERVRFVHPLLASAVASSSDPARKREMHRRLAELARDPHERAVQLVLGSEPPDEGVAARLDEAVAAALSRGSAYSAASLAKEALRFTDPRSERWLERAFAECECELRVGSTDEATARLRRLLETLPAGRERARAFYLLAPSSRSGLTRADVERALADAGDDARLRALILLETMGGYNIAGLGLLENVAETASTLAEAAELARSIGDKSLEVRARIDMAWTQYALGQPVEPPSRRESDGVLHELVLDPDRIRASQMMCRGEFDEAERLLRPLRDRAAEGEEEWSLWVFALQLFDLETRRGDWPAAAERFAELEASAAGIGAARPALLRCAAHLAAIRGDRSTAERLAAEVEATPEASGWQRLYARQVRGVAALADGAAADAVTSLRGIADDMARAGFREPGSVPVAPDLIEALVQAGERDEAVARLSGLESIARELAHPWGLAVAARCRGLVHGDEAALLEAADRAQELPLPFGRARALLALGQLQLRERRRADARRSLTEALELFTTLATLPWADRAGAELARIGGKVASRGELTPAERRVAEAVARGRTNKEAAAELFLSENTIESTLGRVYRKLGIRSRAELVRTFDAAS